MQQEDDLRGLAKVMEFMRAISIVFIVIHVYWFCYRSFVDMGINIGWSTGYCSISNGRQDCSATCL